MNKRIAFSAFLPAIYSAIILLFSISAIAQDTSFVNNLKSSFVFNRSIQSLEKKISVPAFQNAFALNPSLKFFNNFDSTKPQHSMWYKGDAATPDKRRIKFIAGVNVVGYGGAMIGLYSAWYSQYPQSAFHFFDDNNEWKQIDKVGHAYSAYVESVGSMELWRWTGMERKKRIWYGGLSGIAYQTIIETLDGFSTEWGWSWGDMTANVLGSGLVIGQEFLWNDQRIYLKFSAHKVSYPTADLNQRANELYGQGFNQRFIKDYNGQTYWASANLQSFFPKSNLPKWLNVAFGYGADGMFGATENIGRDDKGNVNFDRRDISRYRQYYIAPDIDLTKIKTKHTLIRLALVALNSFKFPAPSIEYNSKGQFQFHLLHF